MNKFVRFCVSGAFLAVFFTSCQRHDTVTPASSLEKPDGNVGVTNGMLAFKDVATYDSHLTQLKTIPAGMSEEAHLSAIENNLKFQSKRSLYFLPRLSGGRTLASEGILDDQLASILNADNMVQIGEWIFKLDLLKGKCYVLPVSEATPQSIDNLKNGILPKGVKTYSTEDNVLELLAEGKPSEMLTQSGRTAEQKDGLFGSEDKQTFQVDPENDVIYDAKNRLDVSTRLQYVRSMLEWRWIPVNIGYNRTF